ncbi:MAG: tRNA (uridine(34)/cytosine(34)/5-carboxymethylaminomethyluridine(34)-2'-O)-methyltransferase TrmL [Caulobacteraceae bacterium]
MSLNIVLVEPEIPQNTGNIARTCAATDCKLHLVKPLGFSVDDKHLKRAGLDYWSLVDINYYDSFEELQEKYSGGLFYYSTTKGKQKYTDVIYRKDCFIVFGKETAGLPKPLLEKNAEYCVRVPMISEARSLNLSNSVAVVVYEALRQIGFPGMV